MWVKRISKLVALFFTLSVFLGPALVQGTEPETTATASGTSQGNPNPGAPAPTTPPGPETSSTQSGNVSVSGAGGGTNIVVNNQNQAAQQGMQGFLPFPFLPLPFFTLPLPFPLPFFGAFGGGSGQNSNQTVVVNNGGAGQPELFQKMLEMMQKILDKLDKKSGASESADLGSGTATVPTASGSVSNPPATEATGEGKTSDSLLNE